MFKKLRNKRLVKKAVNLLSPKQVACLCEEIERHNGLACVVNKRDYVDVMYTDGLCLCFAK